MHKFNRKFTPHQLPTDKTPKGESVNSHATTDKTLNGLNQSRPNQRTVIAAIDQSHPWTPIRHATSPLITLHPFQTIDQPKIRGVTLDNILACAALPKQIYRKLQGRKNILESLARNKWAQELIQSPQLNCMSWNKLQVAQKAVLHIAIGCHLNISL